MDESLINTKVLLDILIKNMLAKSRTIAKGESILGINPKKKQFLLTGEDFLKKNEENMLNVCLYVCNYLESRESNILSNIIEVEIFFHNVFDILNDGLINSDTYQKERENIGIPQFNWRFRIWPVAYSGVECSAKKIPEMMRGFSESLVFHLKLAKEGLISQSELLSWADYMHDLVIHPWCDGCGRMSNVLVITLSLIRKDWKLPLIKDKKEHYKLLGDKNKRIAYYEECIHNGEKWSELL